MVRFNAQSGLTCTASTSENVNDVIARPLWRGKDFLQRTRTAQHSKRPSLYCFQNLADQITVLVWGVYAPSLQEPVASRAHSKSSLDHDWYNISITLTDSAGAERP
jgi:hypothetical protein